MLPAASQEFGALSWKAEQNAQGRQVSAPHSWLHAEPAVWTRGEGRARLTFGFQEGLDWVLRRKRAFSYLSSLPLPLCMQAASPPAAPREASPSSGGRVGCFDLFCTILGELHGAESLKSPRHPASLLSCFQGPQLRRRAGKLQTRLRAGGPLWLHLCASLCQAGRSAISSSLGQCCLCGSRKIASSRLRTR